MKVQMSHIIDNIVCDGVLLYLKTIIIFWFKVHFACRINLIFVAAKAKGLFSSVFINKPEKLSEFSNKYTFV